MRWQEALKIKHYWNAEQARNDLERLIITGERPADKVVGLACQALDKQIPKKPIKRNPICYQRTKDGREKYAYDFHCTLCDMKINKEKHHCPCGQALDWSETE